MVNVVGTSLLGFYIFRGERLWDDYIQLYKAKTCMVMQSKHGGRKKTSSQHLVQRMIVFILKVNIRWDLPN